jgi:hypothetical protein
VSARFRVRLPDHPRWASLRAYCSTHPDELLIQWQTFDGQGVFTVETGNWVADYLGYVPDEAEQQHHRDVGLDDFLSFAIAEPADGDQPHFRYHLRCSRPSCNYHQELTEPITWLHNYVRAMWKAQIGQVDIPDLERWVREQSGRMKRRA